MASAALAALVSALGEVTELERVYPPLRGRLPAARAVGRACVVLLCGHFERYFHAVNEEAVGYLNMVGVTRTAIPDEVRLVHSRAPVEALGEIQWNHRRAKLEEFVNTDAWLWQDGQVGRADHERLLMWMRTPDSNNLIRFYRQWGIADIFSAITRRQHSRTNFFLGVRELVEKRNNIAHGDVAAEASRGDIRRYRTTAQEFCSRADRVFGRHLGGLAGGAVPW